MIMNKPTIKGVMENPIAVKSGTLERRILSVSAHSEGRKPFTLHLPLIAESVLQGFVVPQPGGLEGCLL